MTSTTTSVPLLVREGKLHLPFQLQIDYTRPDGSRCMKVITRAVPSTEDRAAAEKGCSFDQCMTTAWYNTTFRSSSGANLRMVGRHVAGMSAMQALDAQYPEARKTAIAAYKFMERVRLVYFW